jgi:hypothetical protein
MTLERILMLFLLLLAWWTLAVAFALALGQLGRLRDKLEDKIDLIVRSDEQTEDVESR